MRRVLQFLREMPPTLRRVTAWMIFTAIALLVLQATVFLSFQSTTRSPLLLHAFVGVLGFLWFPVAIFHGRRRSQLARALKEHNGHLCPRCEHPLPPTENGFTTCTECGTRHAGDEPLKYWKRWREW